MPTASAPTNSPPKREAEERPCQAGVATFTIQQLRLPHCIALSTLTHQPPADFCVVRVATRVHWSRKGKVLLPFPSSSSFAAAGGEACRLKESSVAHAALLSCLYSADLLSRTTRCCCFNVEQGSHRLTVARALFVPAQSGAGNVRMRRGRRELKGRTGRFGPETGHDAGKTGTRGQKLSWRYPGRARGDAQGAAAGRRALLRDDWRAHGGGVGWLMARRGGLHCVRNFCQVVSSGWGAGGAGPVRHWGL